jgi:hypothetical protein
MLATSGKSVPNVGPAIREPQCGGRKVDEEFPLGDVSLQLPGVGKLSAEARAGEGSIPSKRKPFYQPGAPLAASASAATRYGAKERQTSTWKAVAPRRHSTISALSKIVRVAMPTGNAPI